MAFFTGDIRSDYLGMDTSLYVSVPYDRMEITTGSFPVVYLLHGLGNNASSWVRNTGICRYAQERGVAVIMPEVQKSFYSNMKYGPKYFDYITKELPEMVQKIFNVNRNPENTYIAGLSMGGYGALKCGLTYPENYAGIGSFSGAVNILSVKKLAEGLDDSYQLKGVWGENLDINPTEDLFYLAKKTPIILPEIYITCGTEDFLFNDNLNFSKHLSSLGIKHDFECWEGDHEWSFWDESIRQFLDNVVLKRSKSE